MFTGLVEESGTVRKLDHQGGALNIAIAATQVLDDLKSDDSVCVNGVCLTATRITRDGFEVQAVAETLRKTTLSDLRVGDQVNLERALRLVDRLGGHLVQGHVDDTAKVTAIEPQAGGVLLHLLLPKHLLKYVISEGSITINGVSLTVARLNGRQVSIALIPHTLEMTTLNSLEIGDRVNVEVDLLGKYIENLLQKSEPEAALQRWLDKLST